MTTGSGVGIRSVWGQSGLRLGLGGKQRVAFDSRRKVVRWPLQILRPYGVFWCLVPAARPVDPLVRAIKSAKILLDGHQSHRTDRVQLGVVAAFQAGRYRLESQSSCFLQATFADVEQVPGRSAALL